MYKSTSRRVSLKKQDLSCFPFSDYADCPNDKLDEVAKEHNLTVYSSWMLPQLLAFWGNAKTFKDDNGEYLARPFLEHNIGSDPHKIGIWKVCARLKRSALISGQNTRINSQYSALVPLILCGLKQHQKINYSEWTLDSIPNLVDSLLSAAMLVEPNDVPDLDVARILEIRQQGLTTASGAKAGTVVPPTTKWALTGIGDTELGHLPKHAVTMICQTWVAHPSLRHPNMVLNPNDWDGDMPAPLIAAEVTSDKKSLSFEQLKKPLADVPWL